MIGSSVVDFGGVLKFDVHIGFLFATPPGSFSDLFQCFVTLIHHYQLVLLNQLKA
jgi:hypothetical protein